MQTKNFPILNNKANKLLSTLLILLLFWIGFGVGNNMSDIQYWIDSTWLSIKLLWLYILIYFAVVPKQNLIQNILGKDKFIVTISLLWLSVVILSFMLSPYYGWQNELAFMRLTETVTLFLFFIILWDFFNRYDVDLPVVFASLIIPALIVMGYFVYIHFAFQDLKADDHVFSIRSEKLILNTHLHRIGYQVEAAILLATAFLFSIKFRYIAFCIIVMLSLFLMWLGGRGAILGTIVAFLTLLFIYKKYISIKAFTTLGVVVILSITINSYIGVFKVDYLTHAIQKTLQANSLNHLLTGRIEVWSLVIKNLEGNWILGTGPQSYFFYQDRHQEVIHAHNFILQILGEWGILGSFLFLFLLFHILYRGLAIHPLLPASQKPFHFAAGLSILALLTTALFAGILFFQQSEIYLIVLFAIWTTAPKKNPAAKP